MSKLNLPKKSVRVSVSNERQISIPKEFYDQLNIDEEVILELYGNHLVLRPAHENGNDYSDEILRDLIAQGYIGRKLMSEFKLRKAQMGDTHL
jgi:bifunctional DNA-binding transcriptional regulator/antitoxin component of YhaV-PrlF toxin-antitoxin module